MLKKGIESTNNTEAENTQNEKMINILYKTMLLVVRNSFSYYQKRKNVSKQNIYQKGH